MPSGFRAISILSMILFFAGASPAQDTCTAMGSPSHQTEASGMNTSAPSAATIFLEHLSSGTDVEPASTPQSMWMIQKNGWDFMFHGVAFVDDIQQSGPRGGDKFFSTDWAMGMTQKSFGRSKLTFRLMMSLDPATVTDRRYPELFQVGETAFGRPIVDGQHPHDLFMEIAGFYDLKLGENTVLSLYGAPVGDPALGPPAYPHRASASENPLAPLGHHQQDSTHIADEVVTAGYSYRFFRAEFSGFHGREPNENRWNIDAGSIDSWSARLTINPSRDWSGQFSLGTLKSPEALDPAEDQRRTTASISYNRPLSHGNWASSVIWGRTRSLLTGGKLNSYLAESTFRFQSRNAVWGRVENVDRTNLLTLGENPLPANFVEKFLARVQAISVGYDRDFDWVPHISTALGAEATIYNAPAFLDPIYGAHPFGVVIFVRFRPKSGEQPMMP
jgi:hypothetical protein